MAEAELNALKKLEANKTCINCDTYNKFGHGNICEKYKTFVCSHCKSAHQSFSMRVKSVSMSNWTKEEVDALKEENGGGNAVAKRVWLGKWDDSKMRKPAEHDHIDYFKKFINKVYNDQAFYDEDGYNTQNSSSNRRATTTGGSAPSASNSSKQTQAPVNANLLDFGSPTASSQPAVATFDAFSSSSNWSSSGNTNASNDGWGDFSSSAPVASSSPSDGFGAFASAAPASASSQPSNDGFGAFTSAFPTTTAASTTSNFGNDSFGAFTAAPATTTTSLFDPFAPSNGGATSSAPPAPTNFDPFASTSINYNNPQVASTGINGNFAQSNAAPGKNFDAFDALSAPNLAYGNGSNVMMNGQHRAPGMVGMQQQSMMGKYPQQHQQMGSYQQPMGGGYPSQMNGGFGSNASMNISTFMDPNAANRGNGMMGGPMHGYNRPGVGVSSSRDPFAGLGLPQH